MSCGQIRRFTDLLILKTKSIIYSAVTLIGAVWMYRFLNSGGWLTHHYQLDQLNDPAVGRREGLQADTPAQCGGTACGNRAPHQR